MRTILVLSLLLFPLSLRGETPKLPPDKDLKSLTLNTLLAFNKAAQENNFASFYKDHIASIFREQVSLEKFSENFHPLVEQGNDFGGIATVEPVFEDKPSIDKDGVLTLKGKFPTRPNEVSFRLRYLNEKSAWKLVGINVQAAPPADGGAAKPAEGGAAGVPTGEELKALVLDSLLAFNLAVQDKSFEDFYPEIATVWQDQTTPEKLQESFQTFIDQEINLTPIEKMEPTFEGKPAINSDGVLVVKGTYPTKPSKLSFQLKYIREDTEWKLVGIHVDLKKDPGSKADEEDKTDEKED